jgi:hypothetical protein
LKVIVYSLTVLENFAVIVQLFVTVSPQVFSHSSKSYVYCALVVSGVAVIVISPIVTVFQVNSIIAPEVTSTLF